MLQSTVIPSEDVPDRVLIEAARRGDRQGFEGLMSRYQDRLFVSMRNHVGCPEMADDIVQDAFVRAFQFLDSFKQESEFYTWLFRIALNSRRRYVRKIRATISLEVEGQYTIHPQAPRNESPTMRFERQEQRQLVRDALARLDEHHRTILILREFKGFDYQAIAKAMDLKMGTVRSRLARARARLRAELVDQVSVEKTPNRLAISDQHYAHAQ